MVIAGVRRQIMLITGVVGSDGYTTVMARTDGLNRKRDGNLDCSCVLK
jgi:hypothetical protein